MLSDAQAEDLHGVGPVSLATNGDVHASIGAQLSPSQRVAQAAATATTHDHTTTPQSHHQ